MGLFLLIMGVQGAGKGIQAKLIEKQYGIPQISTGDLFRAMKTRTDAFAQQIQATMAAGHLISDEVTNQVVKERFALPDVAAGAILDGYPRTPDQAQYLDALLAERGDKLGAVLLLELDLYEAFRRAFGRISTQDDSASYNIYTTPELIDAQWVAHPEKAFPPSLHATLKSTGEKLKRRPDDAHAHAIIQRIDSFRSLTAPLISYYQGRGLVKHIDASKTIEEVSAQVQAVISAATG
jgi:adenylate kinase